jgi:glutathione S-transferase
MKVDEKQPLFLKFTSIKYVFHQQNIWDETQNQWLLRERPFNFVPVFKYCYSDSRNLWTVMRAGGLAP